MGGSVRGAYRACRRCRGRIAPALSHALGDQIDQHADDREPDQAKGGHATGEFEHIVGNGFDEDARIIAEDQVDQDDRNDREKCELDERPQESTCLVDEIHHTRPLNRWVASVAPHPTWRSWNATRALRASAPRLRSSCDGRTATG